MLSVTERTASVADIGVAIGFSFKEDDIVARDFPLAADDAVVRGFLFEIVARGFPLVEGAAVGGADIFLWHESVSLSAMAGSKC